MSLPRFSVRQVVLVNLLFVVLIVTGLLAVVRTPLDLFPDVSFNQALVLTVWPGASADDVEKLVTTRLEDEIRHLVSGELQEKEAELAAKRGGGEKPPTVCTCADGTRTAARHTN